jgi:hypothetical protein
VKNLPYKPVLIAVTGICLASFCSAANPPATAAATASHKPTKEQSHFVFSLLPKSFQKNPLLAMTVITEMTEEGKKFKVPSADSPAYYYLVDAGYHQEGHGADEKGKVANEPLERQVKQALAASYYREGTTEHQPTLVLVCVWGAHNKLTPPTEVGGDDGWVDIGYKNLLSRAALVGGNGFAHELEKALNEQSTAGAMMIGSIADPVYRFTNRDDRTRELMEQTLDDCYYVVISAYEGAAIARGEKKLLWRTKMSTASQGVSLAETAPALIQSGSAFFGAEMKESALVSKRIVRGGRVELGTPTVEEYIEKPTSTETSHPAETPKK